MRTILRTCRPVTLAAATLLALAPAWLGAQTIYRIVGPDGSVSFTDRAPTGSGQATQLGPGGRAASGGNGAGELSFELRQLMSRYPVTLYTGDNCEPCAAGRSMLNSRGVPYTERTVKTNEDINELQRLTGNITVPVLSIGGQQLKGYSSGEWQQYLNAAGYPNNSRLPAGYRNPPASPLVPIPEAPASGSAQTEPSREAPPPAPPPPPPPPGNPAGIVF